MSIGVGLVDGFFQGREIKHGWEDRLQRRSIIDAQEERAGETHDLNTRVTTDNNNRANEMHDVNMQVTLNNDGRATRADTRTQEIHDEGVADRARQREIEATEAALIASVFAPTEPAGAAPAAPAPTGETPQRRSINPNGPLATTMSADTGPTVTAAPTAPAMPLDPATPTTAQGVIADATGQTAPVPNTPPQMPSGATQAPTQPASPMAINTPSTPSAATDTAPNRETPAGPQNVTRRGIVPYVDRTGEQDVLSAVFADPAFATMAQRQNVSPEEYWQSLPEEARAQHITRVGNNGTPVRNGAPEPGVDPAFDARMARAAADMVESGVDQQGEELTPNIIEQLRMVQERRAPTNPDGTAIRTQAQLDADYARDQAAQAQADMPATAPELATIPPTAPTAPAIQAVDAPQAQPEAPVRRSIAPAPLQPVEAQPDQARAASEVPQPAALDNVQPSTGAAAVVPDQQAGSTPNMSPAQQQRARNDLQTYVNNDAAQQLRQFWLGRGEFEKVEAFDAYMEREETRAATESWTDAVMAAQLGDDVAFETAIAEVYNRNYGDGYEVINDGKIFVRDGNGNIIGAEIELRNLQTGETFIRELEGSQELYAEAINALSPSAIFEHQWGQYQAANQRETELMQRAQDARLGAGQPNPTEYVQDLVKLAGELADMELTPPQLTPEQVAAGMTVADIYLQRAQQMMPPPNVARAASNTPRQVPSDVPVLQ